MKTKENRLLQKDEELFSTMEKQYVSENEKEFFEKMRNKMERELAPSNDLIMFEEDNEDHIYIVRCVYEEIIIGHGFKGVYDDELHVMTLSEALHTNLKQVGFIDRNITLLEWLRDRNYKGIRYDHNYANL